MKKAKVARKLIAMILVSMLVLTTMGCASSEENKDEIITGSSSINQYSVIYTHDASRGVGIWTTRVGGLFILPDSEYNAPEGE